MDVGAVIPDIYESGKQGFGSMMVNLGKMMAETIMYIDREEVAGPDYAPLSPMCGNGRAGGALCILVIRKSRRWRTLGFGDHRERSR